MPLALSLSPPTMRAMDPAELPASAERALHRAGCRQFQRLGVGQNLVVAARRDGARVVVKLRRKEHAFRLRKEALWMRAAASAGVIVPDLLGLIDDGEWLLLLTRVVPEQGPGWGPGHWRRALAPLHGLPLPTDGWGHLRADGQARFASLADARAHADALLVRAGLTSALCREAVAAYWVTASPCVLHGDAHAGNHCGTAVLDWEHVRIGDRLDEAAHLALSAPIGPHADWAEAWDCPSAAPRWLGARLLIVAEALRHGGPCQAGAQRFREQLGTNHP